MARPTQLGGWRLKSLFDEALGLKAIPRAGWLRAGIDQPESVAAHSWGICWLIVVHAPEGVDTERALKIAVVHDLAEVRTGDITPHDGIGKEEKRQLEEAAARSMFSGRDDLFELWQEYEQDTTPEARLVHDCDKLDMGLQALHYAKQTGVDTSEFIQSARAKIRNDAMLRVLDEAARA
jgi:putative hydrolase of HD superfamily